jgi:hypothetical protein
MLFDFKLNVIVGTYNEEFMLPHWLEHHVPMFDHGIVLDYKSTDKTLEIIKKIAPNWEVVTAKNYKYFDAEINDKELMECEERLPGWKVILNTTEFVFTHNLRKKIIELDKKNINEARFFGYQINDSLEEKEKKIFDNKKNIVLQKFNGKPDPYRHRIIHKNKNGSYYVGRHYDVPHLRKSPHVKKYSPSIPIIEGLYLLWYRFAPFYEQIPRKMQASPRIPKKDIKKGYSWNHANLDPIVIEERWKKELPNCKNLLEDPKLLFEFEKIKEKYYKNL